MQNPRISIIAAIGSNRELGKGGDLIWRIGDDLKRLKALTTGHPIIMGRKTYASIGHPLPNRTNIVISRSDTPIDGCVVCNSLPAAISAATETGTDEIFIFGGESIYEAALPITDRLYLTLIDATDSAADVCFPAFHDFQNILFREVHPEHVPPYTWLTLER